MFRDWQILVVGAGTMGAGIAQVYASGGLRTTLVDLSMDALTQAERVIAGNLSLLAENGLISGKTVEKAKARIAYETGDSLSEVASTADLVVESIFEDPDVKRTLFDKLDRYCRSTCILCSNTSASNIFEIAEISHPERLLITHWFNPPFLMDLVEIVSGPETATETLETVQRLHEQLGKQPAVINRYIPGFIVNRLATALMREAGHMVTQGWTTPRDIDTAIRATSGVRYAFEGPMALYDIVGWDLIQKVALDLHESLCSSTRGGNPLGAELVSKGDLGLKTGKGAFDYQGIDPDLYMRERADNIIRMVRAIHDLNTRSDRSEQ